MSNKSPIIPTNITYNDLKYRLQNIQCCLPNKATELLNRINLGINCCNEERELNIATAYLDILRCYITDWETPYKYTYSEEVTSYPYIIFTIFIPVPINSGDAFFNGFEVYTTGYSQSYPTPTNLNTIISDYISATGLSMVLLSESVGFEGSYFEIKLEVPCEYSEQNVAGAFTYETDKFTITVPYAGTATVCNATIVNIEGPTYTNQDSANCLTREEVVNMFEWLQKYCCMCFPNYGNYDNVVTID